MTATSASLRNRGLPKWPQMIVAGKGVTRDQAKEIIRRTDRFFVSGHGGNDHAWDKALADRCCMPHYFSWIRDEKIDWQKRGRQEEVWHRLWGSVQTEYVKNYWISASLVSGPQGWCSPSGAISYGYNVGKWPSVEDVEADWQKLAQAFPFLDLTATLMSAEYCEDANPVVTIRVRQGEVTLEDPGEVDRTVYAIDYEKIGEHLIMPPRYREHGPIPQAWYDEWAALGARICRIGGPSGADGDVLSAMICRDGVPDLLGKIQDLRGMVAFRNVMPALLAIAKAALERQAAIDRDATDETRLLYEKRLLEAVMKVTR